MGFKPTSHNEIFLDHLEIITDFLIEQCPIESKKALSMLRGSTGISLRYVKEHVDSLLSWGIIRKSRGYYEWGLEGVRPAGIKLDMKNEDVPDTFPGDIGELEIEIRPCIYRNDELVCSAISGHAVKVNADKCNRCGFRKEE